MGAVAEQLYVYFLIFYINYTSIIPTTEIIRAHFFIAINPKFKIIPKFTIVPTIESNASLALATNHKRVFASLFDHFFKSFLLFLWRWVRGCRNSSSLCWNGYKHIVIPLSNMKLRICSRKDLSSSRIFPMVCSICLTCIQKLVFKLFLPLSLIFKYLHGIIFSENIRPFSHYFKCLLSFFMPFIMFVNFKTHISWPCMVYKDLIITKSSCILLTSAFYDALYILTWICSGKIESSISGRHSIAIFVGNLCLSLVETLEECSNKGGVSSMHIIFFYYI